MGEPIRDIQRGRESRRMRGNRNNVKWFFKIHRRLIKPPYPVLLFCPNCGNPFIEINHDIVEISNDFGLPYTQLTAKNTWIRQKHERCGAKITLYWAE